MKYRFHPSNRSYPAHEGKHALRLRGYRSLRRISPSDFYRLRDPEPYAVPYGGNPKKERNHRLRRLLHSFGTRCKQGAEWLSARLRREKPTEGHRTLPMFSGALSAALAVTLLSLLIPTVALFAPYKRSYTSVTIPDFKGKDPALVLQGNEPFNLILRYEINPEVPSGFVISQSPPAGVSRRIYSDKDYCDIHLIVSQSPEHYTLEDLTDLPQREAALLLRNEGILTEIQTEHSSKEAGTVLGTLPPSGTPLREGDKVTLRVSLGKKPLRAYVPDLSGLDESTALRRLSEAGLRSGEVIYRSSALPLGTVIGQEYTAYTMIEAGSEVSLTVSLGDRYELRTVPDLYGLSVEEAALLLREYGLTVGQRYTVENAAPVGTVITQSPLPDTPITSATYAVDLYLSSSFIS